MPHIAPRSLYSATGRPSNLFALGAALVCVACGPPVTPKWVHCHDTLDTVVCRRETTCQVTAAQVCALYLDGDLNLAKKYPSAQYGAECPADSPLIPCACDYGDTSNPTECIKKDSQSPPPPPDAAPTGGPAGPSTWVCSKHSQSKCVLYNRYVDPWLDPKADLCMVNPNQTDNYQACVIADNVQLAQGACESTCKNFEASIHTMLAEQSKWLGEDEYTVVKPLIDCKFDDNPPGDYPFAWTDGYICDNQANLGPFNTWGGATIVKAADVVPTTAPTERYAGYLAWDVAQCTAGVCDLTIDALGFDRPGTALFARSAVMAPPCKDSAPSGMQLAQVVRGKLQQAQGTFELDPGAFLAANCSTPSAPGAAPEVARYTTRGHGNLVDGVMTLHLTLATTPPRTYTLTTRQTPQAAR